MNPIRILPLLLLTMLWTPLASAQAQSAPRFLRFEAKEAGGLAEVQARGEVVLRLRRGGRSLASAQEICRRLNRMAQAALTAGEVGLRSARGAYAITGRGSLILTVDKGLAQAAQSLPKSLAQSWAAALKRQFAVPYVTLAVPVPLRVPVGETRLLQFGGTARKLAMVSSREPGVASVRPGATVGSWAVRGQSPGPAELPLQVGDEQILLPVAVRYLAAHLPTDVACVMSGPPLPADDLQALAHNAVAVSSLVQPGASLRLGLPQQTSQGLWVRAEAGGPDLFDVTRQIRVRPQITPPPAQPTALLVISNSPERITAPGLLLATPLPAQAPVRLLWHHVNSAGAPLSYRLRLVNRGQTPAQIHVTDSASGPDDDEVYIGHAAMKRFVRLVGQGTGYVVEVPARSFYDLYAVQLKPSKIVSGLVRLTLKEGQTCAAEVLTEKEPYSRPLINLLADGDTAPPMVSPATFEPAKQVALGHEVGGAWTFYRLGKDFSTNLQGGKLLGDYGVEYTITVTLNNPTPQERRCEILLRGGAGPARATLLVDGQLAESPMLTGSSEFRIWQERMAAGATRVVRIVTMPESGSNYPVTLIVRDIP